ncbi:MAG: hypothetical protein KGJ90_00265 [Patescibacteria group bacterium]|nr:hypothetical protein [Patescibacteria group bacterium]
MPTKGGISCRIIFHTKYGIFSDIGFVTLLSLVGGGIAIHGVNILHHMRPSHIAWAIAVMEMDVMPQFVAEHLFQIRHSPKMNMRHYL